MNKILDFFIFFLTIILLSSVVAAVIFWDISFLLVANWDVPSRATIIIMAFFVSSVLAIGLSYEDRSSPSDTILDWISSMKEKKEPNEAKTIDELLKEAEEFERKIARIKESVK